VAHTYNPSYSKHRDQEDCGLKPTRKEKFMRLYFKETLHKKELVAWLNVKALSSSPSTAKEN
jgi:hypothetical protein